MTFGSTWMPLFGDEFWDSERVADMDGDAVSLYLWLLWRQFKNGSLPPPEKLRRLPHRWQVQWDAVWPQVASCFDVLEDGRLENPKCAEIRAAAIERSRRASKNGKRGGRPAHEPVESGRKATAKRPLSKPKATAKPEQSSERSGEEQRRTETPAVSFASGDAISAPPATDPAPAPRKPRTAPTPTGPHAEVAAWFSAEFERSTGKPYAFEGGKDGAAVRSILQRAGPGGLVEVQERGRSFFADQFHRKAGFTLTRFLAAWNALAKPTNAMPTASGSVRALYAEAEQERQRSIDVDGQRVA